MTAEQLCAWLVAWVAALGDPDDPPVDPHRPLAELGLGSRDAVALAGELEDLLDRVVAPTVAWEAPHLAGLAQLLVEPAALPTTVATTQDGGVPGDAIAVVGLGCRLPGASGPVELWQLLRDGVDAVGEVPAGRWDDFADPASPALRAVPRQGGFLADVAGFDAEHFGIPAREATLLDPQQRLLLEVAVEALEHAGLEAEDLAGTDTGVFVGVSVSEYAHLTARDLAQVEGWTVTGSALSMTANRLSYLLDLRGPSLALDTACSSSLVALHTAAASLRCGESSLALVGGVNLLLSPVVTAGFEAGGALAADGRCKPFSAAADGIGRGEGCGVIVLKRYADALRDGDRVLALVTGSAVNSDGRTAGLTAPSPRAQEAVLAAAWAAAGIDPATVDYVEAHGTGTPLGDPIEARALDRVLGTGRPAHRPLLIGSVKGNLGHLEAAAGVAGVLKVVLALSAGELPASLHGTPASPYLPDRLQVVTARRPWPRYAPRPRAGVSGFGFGGTNAHIIFEQAPVLEQAAAGRAGPLPAYDRELVLAVTGSSEHRVRRAAGALADQLQDAPESLLPAVAGTLVRQRSRGRSRAAVTGPDRASLVAGLRALAAGGAVLPTVARAQGPVFVFSGFGSQWVGMGRELLTAEPAFAAAVDELTPHVQGACGLDVRALLRTGTAPTGLLQTQVVLFAVQVGLARLWESLGVRPAAVIGYSMGEVAAAVTAGALDLPAAVHVMVSRAGLLEQVDAAGGGAMAVLEVSPGELADLAPGEVEVVVHAAPGRCTVAGPAGQVDALVARVEALGRGAWPLAVTGAGHCAAVDPVLPELRAALVGLAARRPALPLFSTVSPSGALAEQPLDADYWVANVRRPVHFAQAVAAAAAAGHTSFLEIAPHPIAVSAVRSTLESLAIPDVSVVGTLRRGTGERAALAGAVGALHTAGHDAVLAAWCPPVTLVDLPPTPWAHRPYWVARSSAPAGPASLLGTHVPLPEGGRHLWRTADARRSPAAAELLALAHDAAAAAGVPLARVGEPQVVGGAVSASHLLTSLVFTGPGTATVTVHSTEPPHALLGTVLLDTAGGQQPASTVQRLQAVLARVMGQLPGELDPAAALTDLGLDSLTATRARNAVQDELGVAVPVRLLLQGASLTELARLADERHEHGQPHEPDVVLDLTDPSVVPVPRAELRLVPPRDPSERLVAAVWLQVLGRAPHGVHEPLSSYGGTVAQAASLAEGIARRIGRAPDLAELLAAGTVEAMADLVRADVEGDGSQVLRVLRAGGTRRPLFVFHPAGGPTSVYRELVDLLDDDQPVYGFERLADADTVEEKARRYLLLLREVQPVGPYRLLGWSLGGVLAIEVAQQLTAAGEQVELLGAIDTIQPLDDPDTELEDLLDGRYRRFAEHVLQTYGATLVLPDDLAAQPEDRQVEVLLQALTEAGVALPAGVLQHQYTSYVDARIAERYEPRPYTGRLVLFRAERVEALTTSLDPRYARTDPTLGWERTVPDLEVVPVPGDHISMIDLPHVRVLASQLQARLDALQPAGEGAR